MQKIKYSPKIIGPINTKQFIVMLAGFIVIGMVYKILNLIPFVVVALIVIVSCVRYAMQLKNTIDIVDMTEDSLKQQQMIMSRKEYRFLVFGLFRTVRREIGSLEATIISNAEKGMKMSEKLESRLVILQEKRDFMKKEIERVKGS